MCYDAPEAKHCQISTTKISEMLLDFHHGNLAPIPNALRKHRSWPHLFRNQTSKPNSFKASRANANSSFLIANVQKLRFYQNKRLFLDRHCGVPNTFPTCNQTSKLKNQDFLLIHIRKNEWERIEISKWIGESRDSYCCSLTCPYVLFTSSFLLLCVSNMHWQKVE